MFRIKTIQNDTRCFQVMILTEHLAKKLKTQSESISAGAEVKAMFLQASISAEHGTESGERSENEMKNTQTFKTVTGEKMDPETQKIPTALQPGILSAELASICSLFEIGNRDSEIGQKCFEFVKSQRFCYSNLPSKVDRTNDFQTLREHVFSIRSFEHCLDAMGTPVFGWKFKNQNIPEIRSVDTDIANCMMDCSVENCPLALVSNGKCHICSLRKHDRGQTEIFNVTDNGDEYSTQTCFDQIVKNGANSGWVNSDGSCVVDYGSAESDDHCFNNIEPCVENEDCFGIVQKRPHSHSKDDPFGVVGLPLNIGDEVVADSLGESFLEMSLSHEEKCLLEKSIFHRFLPGEIPVEIRNGMRRGEVLFNSVLHDAANVCAKQSLQIEGADSFEIKWADIEEDLNIDMRDLSVEPANSEFSIYPDPPNAKMIDVTTFSKGSKAKLETDVKDHNLARPLMDMKPRVVQQYYRNDVPAEWWGKPRDQCLNGASPLRLGFMCRYFKNNEVTINSRQTDWSRKSKAFSDLKTGAFVNIQDI